MRMPDYGEDIISLSLKAAYDAIYRGKINPKDIDAVFVGTETMTYSVKSVSNILVDLLGVSKNCLTQDIYNACAAQTLAILNAIALVEKGIINKALVIGADISYYEIGEPSELTQGSGAVALIISKEPRLVKFSKDIGKVSSNINDFFRPANEINAQVFGKYSIKSYLNFQIDAYDDLISQVGEFYADHYLFHAPYAKLPIKCMEQIIIKRMLKNPDLTLNNELNEDLVSLSNKIYEFVQSISLNSDSFHIDNDTKDLNSDWIESHFKERVFPPLKIPLSFGNMYSASIWAQLLYILESSAKKNDIIYFGSYGSGATCISGLLKVKATLKSDSILQYYFRNKIKRNINEYENIRKGLIKPRFLYGFIDAHEKSKDVGIFLHFCNEGCIIPSYRGLDYCPKGHEGLNRKFFPLYARLTSDPLKSCEPYNELNKFNLVKIAHDSKRDSLLELHVRRIEDECDTNTRVKGLLNWIPIYVPTNRLNEM